MVGRIRSALDRGHPRDDPRFAVVRDERERVLLVRRIDDGNWELPGGRVEVGETATDTLVREVAEESGSRVEPTDISGVYSDPAHIVVYAVEGVLQQFAVCFQARRVDPDNLPPRPDGVETSAAAWFAPADIRALRMHPEVRRRLDDGLRPAASPPSTRAARQPAASAPAEKPCRWGGAPAEHFGQTVVFCAPRTGLRGMRVKPLIHVSVRRRQLNGDGPAHVDIAVPPSRFDVYIR
jgi:8-oxo-dGTP pyrophosphatase MutT (NUDIX family)